MKEPENVLKGTKTQDLVCNEILPKLVLLAGEQPEEFTELLIRSSKLRPAIKDQYLEDSKAVEDGKLIYMISGIARTYYDDPVNDKTIISRIWKKGEVILDIDSFQHEQERIEHIQMLEEGEILTISYTNLKLLLDRFPKMISFLLCLQAERERYSRLYQRLLIMSVEERVKLYLDKNPGIMSRVNNDYVATHLGMSRSRLSTAYAIYKQQNDAAE